MIRLLVILPDTDPEGYNITQKYARTYVETALRRYHRTTEAKVRTIPYSARIVPGPPKEKAKPKPRPSKYHDPYPPI